jgi:hypothetical protein
MVVTMFSIPVFAKDKGDAISENEASTVAVAFVASLMRNNSAIQWKDNTVLEDVTYLYDENENLTAYNFQLSKDGVDNGYVIVSADTNQDLILEYAFDGAPEFLQESFSYDKVYYFSALDIAYKSGNDYLDSKGKKSTENDVKKGKDKSKKNPEKSNNNKKSVAKYTDKDTITSAEWKAGKVDRVDPKDEKGNNRMQMMADDGTENGAIINTYVYVNYTFSPGWSSAYWGNSMEDYMPKDLAYQCSSNPNCGLVALTNIMGYHRNRGYASKIQSNRVDRYNGLYTASWQVPNAWIYGGVSAYKIDEVAVKYFQNLGYIYSHGNDWTQWGIDWPMVVTEIDNMRPFVVDPLTDAGGTDYEAHAVAAYAYSAYSQDGFEVHFLKVADGWYNNTGRYLCVTNFNTITTINRFYPY